MPYEVAFTKHLNVALDSEKYFNEECWGGDVIIDKLLPSINARYEDVFSNQEDWGWFIWCRKGRTSLGVDVFCDSPAKGSFRIHLTSRQKRRWLGLDRVIDTPELDELKALVEREIAAWSDAFIEIRKLNAKHLPEAEGTT